VWGFRKIPSSGIADSKYYSIAIVRLRLTALAICSCAFLLAWMGLRSVTPEFERGVLPLAPATPYIRFTPDSTPTATAVLIHGLNSNKEIMQTFAMALADAGVETYAIDLPGHGDSSAPFTYTDSLRAIEAFLDSLEPGPGDPIVIGHSMGGALLTDLAPARGFQTMLLLSPAPIPLADFSTDRLLVVTGALEAPPINRFIPALIDATTGDTLWWKFADATHSTALFDPGKIRQMVNWVVDRDGNNSEDAARLGTLRRYGWLILMALAGIAGPIPFIWRPGKIPTETRSSVSLTHTLLAYVAASGAVVLLLRFINPMAWLSVFRADYLIGFVFVVGLFLWRGRRFSVTAGGLAIGLIGAAYVIGVLVVGVAGHLVHLVPSGIQWFWFSALIVAGLPLFLHDEQTLRRVPLAWKRWGMFLLTRAILWAAVLTGVLLLNTEDSFLVLVMHFVVVFWALLWWMTGFIARRTGEAGAAALFAAVVHAWTLAALFVRV
jgi:pimeloyl-ACP methyl ester carboxylesterase